MEAFLIILGAVVVIVIACAVAFQFRKIAEMKGHGGVPFFWWTFLLGPIGMLMVVALPDRAKQVSEIPAAKATATPEKRQDEELPDL